MSAAGQGTLKVVVGHLPEKEIAELYRELAQTCIHKPVRRLLIVTGSVEPAGQRALREALTPMVLTAMPANFRLALVIAQPRAVVRYRDAQRDLIAAGVRTQLFESEDAALAWLCAADAGQRRAA